MPEATRDVLQVITSTQRRGAEQFAVALEPKLREMGLSVETVALADVDGGLDVRSLGNGMTISTLRVLRREIRASRLVAAHGSVSLPACALAGFGTGTPFVYRNIGDPAYWGSTLRRRIQSRLLLGRTDQVVALAPLTRTRLHELYNVPLERCTVIPRGVDETVFTPITASDRAHNRERYGIDADAQVALFLGSLTEEKNVFDAIRAIGLLDDWVLLIAGDGPDRQDAERLADEVAPGRVLFAGVVAEPMSVLAASDLLVLTSHTEGIPGAVIEAALTGVPSVVTDVGFIRSLVDDGVSGLVVDDPSPDAIAKAILDVAGHPADMGHHARQIALDGFSLTSCATKWHTAITALIEQEDA